MKTRRRVTRVSGRQLEMLWEFLNTNRDIAIAYNRSLQAKEYSQRKWREITEFLNSQGDGTHKDWRGWSKYWVDYKGKLKAKVAAVRSSHVRIGAGPFTDKPLMEIEAKFLQLLGEDFGKGLPGVKVEPFPEPQQINNDSVVTAVQESLHSESILQYIQNQQRQGSPTEPIQAALPKTPCLPQSSYSSVLPTTNHSPRRRRRKREPPMTPEAARRAFVHLSQMRADTAVRTAKAMEKMAANITELQNTAKKIERYNKICLQLMFLLQSNL